MSQREVISSFRSLRFVVTRATLVIRDIGELATCDPVVDTDELGVIEDAMIVVSGDRIAWVGPEEDLPEDIDMDDDTEEIEAEGRAVIPGLVDAHTHLVFGGTRREEFAARAAGDPYDAGGILTTVKATRQTDHEELVDLTTERAIEMLIHGTTTAEAKTGYSLTADGELGLLRVLNEVNESQPLDLEITFLGAHAVPEEFEDDAEGYVDLVCEVIPLSAQMARWCDVFCDIGAFSPDQAWRILEAGKASGLLPRIHANELASSGGVDVAASVGAASADHLLYLHPQEARNLAAKGCVGVLCPATALSLGRFPPAKMMKSEGMSIAIASDFNPGTAYCENLQFALAIATRTMGMGTEDALLAATRGGAAALHRTDIGRLAAGCLADIVMLEADSYLDIGYHAGINLASMVVKRGKVVAA